MKIIILLFYRSAQIVYGCTIKREVRHNYAAYMGAGLAVDGFLISFTKPDGAALNGKVVNRNCKDFWG